MAKKQQDETSAEEKKVRKRLKKAEAAYQKTHEQVQKAQVALGKATTRLERRAAAAAEARTALEALVASPTMKEDRVLPVARGDNAAPAAGASALETAATQPADMGAPDVAGVLEAEASPAADIEVAGQLGGAAGDEPAPAGTTASESPPTRAPRRSRRASTAGQEVSAGTATSAAGNEAGAPDGGDETSVEERAEALGLIVP